MKIFQLLSLQHIIAHIKNLQLLKKKNLQYNLELLAFIYRFHIILNVAQQIQQSSAYRKTS